MRESLVAAALVLARLVGAGPVAADAGVEHALVGVDAGQPRAVQLVAVGARAAERAVRVDAAPALADVGPDFAFVQVLVRKCGLEESRFNGSERKKEISSPHKRRSVSSRNLNG